MDLENIYKVSKYGIKQHKNYSKWRSFTLVSIYFLFIVHIIHWQLNKTTLAPLELNELLYTLESGIVTAGFLLMAFVAITVFIFGRFFCGWFCHILALQDLCGWMLGKIGIRPKAVRSRVLWIVPILVMGYMFVWPQILRIIQGRAFPKLKIEGSNSDWASFITDDFWRNLPDPWIAGATFLVCGFIIVYVLGSRGFCSNMCPYGAIFAIADKVAPGKIVLTGDCDQCGICTSQCDSQIRIHEEVHEFRKVVDTNCLKDLDCVSVCPKQALSFGFTKPTLLTRNTQTKRKILKSHFNIFEEILISVIFLTSVIIYRGLYDSLPFLMSLGMAGIFSYLMVVTIRVFTYTSLRFNRIWLRQNNKIKKGGWIFLTISSILIVISLHSATIRWHEYSGNQHLIKANYLLELGQKNESSMVSKKAVSNFEYVENWGLFHSVAHNRKLATIYDLNNQPNKAKKYFNKVLKIKPDDLTVRWKIVSYMLKDKKYIQARLALIKLTDIQNQSMHISQEQKIILAMSHTILGNLHIKDQEPQRALKEYNFALGYLPNYAPATRAIYNLEAN